MDALKHVAREICPPVLYRWASGSSGNLPPGNELEQAGVVAMSVPVLDVGHHRSLEGEMVRIVGARMQDSARAQK